jgi:hypothetical protein
VMHHREEIFRADFIPEMFRFHGSAAVASPTFPSPGVVPPAPSLPDTGLQNRLQKTRGTENDHEHSFTLTIERPFYRIDPLAWSRRNTCPP